MNHEIFLIIKKKNTILIFLKKCICIISKKFLKIRKVPFLLRRMLFVTEFRKILIHILKFLNIKKKFSKIGETFRNYHVFLEISIQNSLEKFSKLLTVRRVKWNSAEIKKSISHFGPFKYYASIGGRVLISCSLQSLAKMTLMHVKISYKSNGKGRGQQTLKKKYLYT